MSLRRWTAIAVAGGVVLAGCGSSHHKAAPTTTLAPTTLAPTTLAPTTTTAPAVFPLTGEPAGAAATLHRPALVVKIDNVDAARPQTGVGSADVVYEEMVEGGVTRLAAVFQSVDAGPLGPVRSGRSTDIAIVSDLNHPLFGFSGANSIFLAEIRAAPIIDVDAEKESSAQYYRMGPHAAPHNLYTSTKALYGLARGATNAPPPLFAYRAAGAPVTAAGATPAVHVQIGWPQASVTWDWNAPTGTWFRGQNGTADVDTTGYRLQAANVVIQFVNYTTDGVASGEGIAPEPIPKGKLVDSGQVFILTGGRLVKGTWSRPAIGDVTTYTDSAGHAIQLAPGRTWVELPPVGTIPQITP
jgi:hypothetical protein